MRNISRPAPGEYSAYTRQYIKLLPEDGLLLQHMRNNLAATQAFFLSLPARKLTYRYAEGKWTIKEVLLHMSDNERIHAYRALRFARNDQTPLPGFAQDDYVPYSEANDRTLDSLLTEFTTVRLATISLFEGLPEETSMRRGVAAGHSVTVRALAYHIAGHELHHLNLIKERYG